MNQEDANQKILEIMNKNDSLSPEEIQLFKKLIHQCDLNIRNNLGYTILMFSFIFNSLKNLNLSTEQWDYLLEHSDLNQQDYNNCNPFMYFLKNNQINKLNLTKNQLNYLIQHSDLTQQDIHGWNPLMLAFYNNQSFDILGKTQLKNMYVLLTEEQKQKTFTNIIQYSENDLEKEKIYFLIYDCQFQIDKRMIDWLLENDYQNILDMIEKRDVFSQLHQDVQLIENKEKINTIKI
jgi:ankyrin repeat protein